MTPGDQASFELNMPPLVKAAAALTLLLAAYGLVMALPILLTGLFVGPHVLVAGALHAALGRHSDPGMDALTASQALGKVALNRGVRKRVGGDLPSPS